MYVDEISQHREKWRDSGEDRNGIKSQKKCNYNDRVILYDENDGYNRDTEIVFYFEFEISDCSKWSYSRKRLCETLV